MLSIVVEWVCRREDAAGALPRRLENDMVETERPAYWRSAFRIELRAAAINLAARGWPVLPGTYPGSKRIAVDDAYKSEPNRIDPVPVQEDWQQWIGSPVDRVTTWWAEEPYSVLVATGTLLDAIEVDDELGRQAAALLRVAGMPAPIVALPSGRWLFLTAASNQISPSLAEAAGVQWHGVGSWVPLPPTPCEGGVVQWRVQPEIWDWRLPRAGSVYEVLEQALSYQHPRGRAVQSVTPLNSAA